MKTEFWPTSTGLHVVNIDADKNIRVRDIMPGVKAHAFVECADKVEALSIAEARGVREPVAFAMGSGFLCCSKN